MKIIIDSEITEQTSFDFIQQTSQLADGEPLEVEITSEGGSVTAGNVIVSKLRELSKSGHKTTAHVVSIAASMASVIACACDELIVDSNAFLMVHSVWTCVEGNANELRKEADTLDLFTKSLISVYRTKFNKTDDEIMSMLEAETWILGEQAKDYGLNCIVNDIGSEIKIAAKCDLSKFKNIPKAFAMEKEEKKPEHVEETKKLEEENKEKVEEALEEVEKTETTETTEEIEEQKPTYEELEQKIQELEEKIRELEEKIRELEKPEEEETQEQPEEETVTASECQKRVSGMQAKMQLHVNDLMGQLKAKDKELTDAKAKVISLTSELESKAKELSEKASALAEKENALAMLNAGVNKMPTKSQPSGWGSLEGKEFFDYLKKNNGILTIKNK